MAKKITLKDLFTKAPVEVVAKEVKVVEVKKNVVAESVVPTGRVVMKAPEREFVKYN